MATAKKTSKTAPAATGTALARWDEELAKYADKSEAQEDTAVGGGGMKYFSLKSGVLAFDDNPMPGNKVAVIILDAMFEHTYYAGKYDPNVKVPPTCFALGRDEGELAPHKSVVEREQQQHDQCIGCPMNEFGSADTGRGKACKNVRRLALIPAGTFDKKTGELKFQDSEEHYATADLAFLKVPVTSTTNFKVFTKQVAQSLRRPPFAVVAEISVVPDAKTQFQVKFQALQEVPLELLDTIFKRVEEAKAIIETPYNLDEEEPPAKPAGRGKPAAKAPVKAKPGKRY